MAYSITKSHGTASMEPRTGSVKFIVVHYTAGGSRESGAKGNLDYFKGGSAGRNASAHYILDESVIYEYADPAANCCYHCGDGNGQYGITNQNSVGIEVAAPPENAPYSAKEIDRLTYLVQYLMKQFNVSADHVVRHYDASRKPCPWYYTPSGAGGDAAWKKLHKQITNGDTVYSGDASDSSGGSGETYVISDPAVAYAVGINNDILFAQEDIYPFIISIDQNTPDLDVEKLKDFDVIGACIDMGSFYTVNHLEAKVFRNPKLDKQYKMFKDAGMTIGLSTHIRAKTEAEILKELYEIRLAVLKYPPDMGLWLIPSFHTTNKKANDKLVKSYYDALLKLGFYDQVGFYCKKEELEKFNWKDVCEEWYWWMDRHLKSVDNIHNLPTPDFFRYENPKDEEALIEPDFEGAANLSLASGNSGDSDSSELETDIQKKVCDIAETGSGLNLVMNMCAAFVSDVYQKAGLTRPGGNAIDFWTNWKSSGGTGKNAPPGAVVVGSGYGAPGSIYGHVGIMLTGGRVVENAGGRRINASIDDWTKSMDATCRGIKGYIGWVWPNNQDLRKMGKKLKTASSSSSSSAGPTGATMSFYDFMSAGVVQGTGQTAGYKFTYYSETILPGGGLNIPGRHVAGGKNGQGYVMDGDGFIVLAKPANGRWQKGDTISTPFGKGKFYDHCPEGNIDVYVHYP